MVSSVFITLASPHRGTVTQQQQPTLQAHSSPVGNNQQTAVRLSSAPPPAQKKDKSANGVSAHNKEQTALSSSSQNPARSRVAPSALTTAKACESAQSTDALPTPPVPAVPLSPKGTAPFKETPLPPPATFQDQLERPLTSDQQPVYGKEIKPSTTCSGLKKNQKEEQSPKTNPDTSEVITDVCGFCRKHVNLSEPAIEALNRTYHEACFQCRSCHILLASKQYYNKAGIPLCEDCYQASLEVCWACGEVIKHQVMRALERAYHPQCFTCTTCKQQIGEQRFAQGEVGEVYCLPDYYRKYAPKCNACQQLIIPKEDGTDSYTVECLGHSYHEDCYRCEMCLTHLTPEPSEHGCYPLDGKLLCKPCHLSLISA